MPHLEPTYLRYIYDGLVKGSIHPENAAELPDGLIGLYEEAFDERTSVVERQKLLKRFAIWALLKKEVSAAFVAEVLGETEDDIQEFILTYSAWFNSPESGKYQLYHERLKVYLLQKLSEKEIHELHEKLILLLEKAIKEQKADEFEWYGLEFLGGHYGANAMLIGDGSKLLALAYDQIHWQRQLKISKGFNWTKTGLKAVMTWASKYNDDEVIECGLQMVDLHNQEQNAAPQIVALVAEGDFDSALKRIEQFGGNDKEGLQRKFILYMLCLMELTLLESKDKPFRKEGIEKLLKHLDQQLPVNHSVLNWSEFFGEEIVKKIIGIIDDLNFDTSSILIRSKTEENINLVNSRLHNLNYNLILDSFQPINVKIINNKENDEENSKSHFHDALIFLKNGNKLQALNSFKAAVYFSNLIPEDDMWGSYGDYMKSEFVDELLEQDYNHLAVQMYLTMQKNVDWDISALESLCYTLLSRNDGKNLKFLYENDSKNHLSFKAYCHYLFLNNKIIPLKSIILSHLRLKDFFVDGIKQFSFFLDLVSEYPYFNTLQYLVNSELNSRSGGQSFGDKLLLEFCSSQKVKTINNQLLDLLDLVKEDYCKAAIVRNQAELIFSLNGGADFIIKNGVFREDGMNESYFEEIFYTIYNDNTSDSILTIASSIEYEFFKFSACKGILSAYFKNNKQNFNNLKKLYISVTLLLTKEDYLEQLLYHVCSLLIKKFDFEKSFELSELMKDCSLKTKILCEASACFRKAGNLASAVNVIRDFNLLISSIIDEKDRNIACRVFSEELIILGEIQKALICANSISDKFEKNKVLLEIFLHINQVDEAIKCAQEMEIRDRVRFLIVIAKDLNTRKQIDLSFSVLEQARKEALNCNDAWNMKRSIIDISYYMAFFGYKDIAISYSEDLDDISKIECLIEVTKAIKKQVNKQELNGIFNKTLIIVQNLKEDDRIHAYKLIIKEFKHEEEYNGYRHTQSEIEKTKFIIHEAISLIRKSENIGAATIKDFQKLLSELPKILIKKGLIQDAVKICELMPLGSERSLAWENLVKCCIEEIGLIETIAVNKMIHDKTANFEFFETLAENIPVKHLTFRVLCHLSINLMHDARSLEKVIHYFALNQIFFENAIQEKTDRFNLTHNLQWAIDIKNQLPN